MVRRSSKKRVSDKCITELGKYSSKYALSELLYCEVCGSPYRRKTWTRKNVKKIYWRCLNRLENGNDACTQSKGIEEWRLHEAICRGLSRCIPGESGVKGLVKTMLAYASSGEQGVLECQSIENNIRELQSKANEAEEMCIKTQGNKQPYMEQIKKYYAAIAELRGQLKSARENLKSSDTYQAELNQIDSWISEEDVSFQEYNDNIVRYLVESIRVTEDLKIIINMKGGITVTELLYPENEQNIFLKIFQNPIAF